MKELEFSAFGNRDYQDARNALYNRATNDAIVAAIGVVHFLSEEMGWNAGAFEEADAAFMREAIANMLMRSEDHIHPLSNIVDSYMLKMRKK